jgi:hypothetical protein
VRVSCNSVLGFCWLGLAIFSAACSDMRAYRASNPCKGDDCAFETVSSPSGSGFELGFIEFDDQGQLYGDSQRLAVEQHIRQLPNKDLLIVAYVHGWKHDASATDTDAAKFRELMLSVSAAETAYAARHGKNPRTLVGVYLGWRGKSIYAPGLKELTFWDRKSTAEKVGHGKVTEVLNELESIKRQRDQECNGCGLTKLIIVGHSFGADVVFDALQQSMAGRFVRSQAGCTTAGDANCVVEGFGDLVVLLNPAFEAMKFSALSDLSTAQGNYSTSQLPLVVVLTSKADWATRITFPLGRWFSTIFEKTRTNTRLNGMNNQTETIEEGSANKQAIGHFEPYQTHLLFMQGAPEEQTCATESRVNQKAVDEAERAAAPTSGDTTAVRHDSVAKGWASDGPGRCIFFAHSTLKRSDTSAGRNPYLVVYTDAPLIKDHGDVFNVQVQEFVEQVVLIAGQTQEEAKATAMSVE